jgi:hypothetical protein
MELRLQLKICEGCGCLWYRLPNHTAVYCRRCETALGDFPTPETRKMRGRPLRKPAIRAWSWAELAGGAE